MTDLNSHDEDQVPVKLPSGGSFWVYKREKKYFDDRVDRYLEDNLFCVPPGTLISTPKGPTPVEDLPTEGWVYDEDRRKITRGSLIIRPTAPQQVVEIFTTSKRLRCSPNHPILLLRGEQTEPKWVDASDVRPGDVLIEQTEHTDDHFARENEVAINSSGGFAPPQGTRLTKVRTVVMTGELEPMFDVTCPEFHTFIADGIVTHNTNVADLQDLDRIVTLELFCWRWGIWLSQQTDYWNEPIDEKDLSTYLKNTSQELRALKGALGIDKVSRDKVRGEDSVSKYIENLQIRAREFGVMREKQLSVALELFNDLAGRLTLHDNSTEDERLELKCHAEDLLDWLRDEAIPKFNEVDEHFRQNQQRFWIRDQ